MVLAALITHFMWDYLKTSFTGKQKNNSGGKGPVSKRSLAVLMGQGSRDKMMPLA